MNNWNTTLDAAHVKAEIALISKRIRQQKDEIKSTPQPWKRDLWAPLRVSKTRATLLCAIVAHSRGRLHLRKVTRRHAQLGLPQLPEVTLEHQERFIGDRWREFALPAAPPERPSSPPREDTGTEPQEVEAAP